MKNTEPSTPIADGRDERGRFVQGHKHARGNPLAGQVAKLRAALIEAVSEGDIKAVASGLIEAAKGGDVAAAKLLFTYTMGKPVEHDLLARIGQMETLLRERDER